MPRPAAALITKALAERHAAGRRIGSVCTGAMLLAEAGILRGRPAITHHTAIEDLRGVRRRCARRASAWSTTATSSPPPASPRASTSRSTWSSSELGSEAAGAGAREIEWDQMSGASASGRSIGTNE